MKEIVKLPEELENISQNVSLEKRNEVKSVLNKVFNGVEKMRNQIDSIKIENENDLLNMKLANAIRLEVRRVRLDAEKEFDKKRQEVQQQMLSYKTEDSLWLKAKQTMQILTKEIEENAKWKEDTKKRFDEEQKELKIQKRIIQISKFNSDIDRSEFENMSDEMFNVFITGIEKKYNELIEAERKAEEERIAREKAEIEERERIKKENEKLRKEAEERERLAKIEAEKRAKEDIKRKAKEEALNNVGKARQKMLFEIGVSLDFQTCKEMEENTWNEFLNKKNKEYQNEQNRLHIEKMRQEKERSEYEAKLKAEREEKERIEREERAKREKLEAELKAKKEAERKAKEEEEKRIAQIEAEKQAELNKSDSAKVKDLIKDIEILKTKYIFKSVKNKKMQSDVNILLDKIINFINK